MPIVCCYMLTYVIICHCNITNKSTKGSRWFTWVARDGCGLTKAVSITYSQKLKNNFTRCNTVMKKWEELNLQYDSEWFEQYNEVYDKTLSLNDLEAVVRDNQHGIISFPDLNPKTINQHLHGM